MNKNKYYSVVFIFWKKEEIKPVSRWVILQQKKTNNTKEKTDAVDSLSLLVVMYCDSNVTFMFKNGFQQDYGQMCNDCSDKVKIL